jgi:hypothetical protein
MERLADLLDALGLILVGVLEYGDLLRGGERRHPGTPPLPSTRTGCRKACLSAIRLRSNSAKAPKMWKTSLPELVVVSILSVTL